MQKPQPAKAAGKNTARNIIILNIAARSARGLKHQSSEPKPFIKNMISKDQTTLAGKEASARTIIITRKSRWKDILSVSKRGSLYSKLSRLGISPGLKPAKTVKRTKRSKATTKIIQNRSMLNGFALNATEKPMPSELYPPETKSINISYDIIVYHG